MRRVSTLVLPEPAPATMSSAWPRYFDGLALLRVEPVGEGEPVDGRHQRCRRLAPAGRVVGIEDQRHVPPILGAPPTPPRRASPVECRSS